MLRQLLCAVTDLIDPYALPCYVNEVASSICLVVTSAGYSLRAWRLYDRFKCTSLIANGMRKSMVPLDPPARSNLWFWTG
jgi:hypothetical protein